ncbi:MAG: GNAT family N-acetyltransferase [Pseudomonadota bacterium]
MTALRHATRADVSLVLDWAAEEGWNPGLDDAAAFFQADPNGFFVATDSTDQPVAAISVVNHSDHFAFLGLYIVQPAYRGQGIGLRLWQHAMTHAAGRTVGLDGVEAQQQNYVTSGFVHAGGTTRFSGILEAIADPSIRITTEHDIPGLIAQEAAASGVAKPAYLGAWFSNTDHRITLAHLGSGGIDGFCTVRACRIGAKIGPLVAANSDIARRLIAHAASMTIGAVTLDVPQSATALSALCEQLELEVGFKTARMYRGPFTAPVHENFAVVSLELG